MVVFTMVLPLTTTTDTDSPGTEEAEATEGAPVDTAVAAALDGHQNGPEAEEAADAIQRQHFGQDAVAVQVNEVIHPLAATDVHHY